MFSIRLCLLVSIILTSSLSCVSQRTATTPEGLSFEKPPYWFEGDIEARKASLNRFTFDSGDRAKLMANDKSSGIVAIFYRDDPKKTPGIIPTIQIILRPLGANVSFDQFKKAISDPKRMAALEEFIYLGDAATTEISGVRSVLLNATFKLRRDDRVYPIRSRTYAIPRANYFIQISMSDEDDKDWTEKEFTTFISSLKIAD